MQVKALRQNKGKDSKVKLGNGPFKATIYIAKSYPLWQGLILNKLKEMYEVSRISENLLLISYRVPNSAGICVQCGNVFTENVALSYLLLLV